MAIIKNIPLDDSAIWSSEDFNELKKAVEIALPDLKCVLCGDKHFIVRDVFDADFDSSKRSRHIYSRLRSFFPAKASPIINLACKNCGYIMQFDEDIVLTKAGLVPSEENGKDD